MEVSNKVVEKFWISWYNNITANQILRNCKRRHFKLRQIMIYFESIGRNKEREI